MAKKTVISKRLDIESEDGVIGLSQQRTLYADQFTDGENSTPDETPFAATSMESVFEHYDPRVSVSMQDEEGQNVEEEFAFRDIKDFDDEQLIAQSDLLRGEKAKFDAYNAIIRQLKQNNALKTALKDAQARGHLKDAIRALLKELEDAD